MEIYSITELDRYIDGPNKGNIIENTRIVYSKDMEALTVYLFDCVLNEIPFSAVDNGIQSTYVMETVTRIIRM